VDLDTVSAAGDPNTGQALIDCYGGDERAIDTMSMPGPLHAIVRVGYGWLFDAHVPFREVYPLLTLMALSPGCASPPPSRAAPCGGCPG
jgi:hypothetical protein